jgi:Transcription factor WhiB
VTASPSAGREPTPGPPDQVALSLLTFGRGPDADRALWARLIRQARCADSGLDADQWFPVSATAESAAGEAADALAVCRSCPVRSLCLALSLLHWDVGQYGVWGGLVAADRASLRRQMLAPGPEGAARPQHGAARSLPAHLA